MSIARDASGRVVEKRARCDSNARPTALPGGIGGCHSVHTELRARAGRPISSRFSLSNSRMEIALPSRSLTEMKIDGWRSEYPSVNNVLRHLQRKSSGYGFGSYSSVTGYAEIFSWFVRFSGGGASSRPSGRTTSPSIWPRRCRWGLCPASGSKLSGRVRLGSLELMCNLT